MLALTVAVTLSLVISACCSITEAILYSVPWSHVEQLRKSGRKAGRVLFELAKAWAKARGAKKLYISAHSSVESQAFYKAVGCQDAAEINPEHAAREPHDRQMECVL